MDLARLKEEQLRLSRKVLLADDKKKYRTVAGVDLACTGNTLICAIVVMDIDSLRVREVKHASGRAPAPYVPGFLGYREAGLAVETYHMLELDPDVLMVDGNGILHPRRIGLASHFGLLIDKPTIGVAKSLLLGTVKGGMVTVGSEVRARIFQTKGHAKPVYVSPGHRITMDSACRIVEKTLRENKLPVPLHEAHKAAAKVRRRLRGQAQAN